MWVKRVDDGGAFLLDGYGAFDVWRIPRVHGIQHSAVRFIGASDRYDTSLAPFPKKNLILIQQTPDPRSHPNIPPQDPTRQFTLR
jgi:hypothetical protein